MDTSTPVTPDYQLNNNDPAARGRITIHEVIKQHMDNELPALTLSAILEPVIRSKDVPVLLECANVIANEAEKNLSWTAELSGPNKQKVLI